MTERPIIFNGEMVRAIREGRKTQTRRPIKHQPGGAYLGYIKERNTYWLQGEPSSVEVKCPFGLPGDRLWVRESFWCVDLPEMGDVPCLLYEDEFERYQQSTKDFESRPCSLKFGHHPSIHMPRWASRLILEITNIRVERVQEITEEDAIKEGITGPHDVGYKAYRIPGDSKPRYSRAEVAFEYLWDSLYGEGAWELNPWVWVIAFERLS